MAGQYLSSIQVIRNPLTRKDKIRQILNENKLYVMVRNMILIVFFVNDKRGSICLYGNITDYLQRSLFYYHFDFAFLIHVITDFVLCMLFMVSASYIYNNEVDQNIN